MSVTCVVAVRHAIQNKGWATEILAKHIREECAAIGYKFTAQSIGSGLRVLTDRGELEVTGQIRKGNIVNNVYDRTDKFGRIPDQRGLIQIVAKQNAEQALSNLASAFDQLDGATSGWPKPKQRFFPGVSA